MCAVYDDISGIKPTHDLSPDWRDLRIGPTPPALAPPTIAPDGQSPTDISMLVGAGSQCTASPPASPRVARAMQIHMKRITARIFLSLWFWYPRPAVNAAGHEVFLTF